MKRKYRRRLKVIEAEAKRRRAANDPYIVSRLLGERITSDIRKKHGLPPLTKEENQRLYDAKNVFAKACEEAGLSPWAVRLDRFLTQKKFPLSALPESVKAALAAEERLRTELKLNNPS